MSKRVFVLVTSEHPLVQMLLHDSVTHGVHHLSVAAERGELSGEFTRLDPGLFASEWPGAVTGTLIASRDSSGWQATLDPVVGELRGEPLQGNAEISV